MITKGLTRNLKKGTIRAFASTNKEHHELNSKYMAHNYAALEEVIATAKGVWLTDVEGKKYLDFHSGYCAANQGHCHPKIVETLINQAKRLGTPSRAFHNDAAGPFAELMSKTFGYDKILPSSSGVEACESAVKLARRWGYVVKGVEEDKAHMIFPKGCFWGRSITACSASDDPMRYEKFGPLTPGFTLIDYNDLDALEKELKANPNIVAYMAEPIQGEGGVIIPEPGYMKKAHDL